jgi:GTPase SAR1 family protein
MEGQTSAASSPKGDSGRCLAYYVNMDPAVQRVPFAASIDIRETVDYKQVMQQYKLGPNGAIMTSLNLFATRFDQVLDILEQRAADPELRLSHLFFDTPGQIEVFTWSASGMIITETLALKFPTVLLYVVDTPRASNPTTFMSNMLYACSMLYKTNLPLVVVFNKTDVAPAEFAKEWMSDFEKFQEALDTERDQNYMTSLNRSMGLVLDEFYRNLRAVAVSSATGAGISELLEAIRCAAAEYERDHLPEVRRRKVQVDARAKQRERRRQQGDVAELVKATQAKAASDA